MTGQEILDLIRRQADVDTDDISDADILSFVNEAKDKVESFQDWPFLEATSTDSVTAGQQTVDLPGDFAHLREARWVDAAGTKTPLVQINPEERPLSSVTSGTPTYIWSFGGVWSLWRPPANNGSVEMLYYKNPPALLVNTSPLFDDRFHGILVHGGLVKVYERIDYWEEARIAKADFDEGIARMDLFYLRLRQAGVYGQRAASRGDIFDGPRFDFEV